MAKPGTILARVKPRATAISDSADIDTKASRAAAPRMRNSVRRAARAIRVIVAIRFASGDKGAASSSKMADVQGRESSDLQLRQGSANM